MMRSLGSMIARTIEALANLGGYLSGWLVFLMMILVVFEVFMRYVLKRPPMIADEFAGYMLVVISYLGTAYAFKEGGHVRITFLADRIPKKISTWFRLITLIMALFFVIVMIKQSYNLLEFSLRFNMKSSTWLNFPLKWPQMALLIGFLMLLLILIVHIAKNIMDLKSGKGRTPTQA